MLNFTLKYIAIIIAILLLILLNFKIWTRSHKQEEKIVDLQKELNFQIEENNKVKSSNNKLKEKINSLKLGSYEMIEEEARKDFGMVKDGETYYQIEK